MSKRIVIAISAVLATSVGGNLYQFFSTSSEVSRLEEENAVVTRQYEGLTQETQRLRGEVSRLQSELTALQSRPTSVCVRPMPRSISEAITANAAAQFYGC